MFVFQQSTGILSDVNGNVLDAHAYAGGNIPPNHNQALVNNPAVQNEVYGGPLPRNVYRIGPALNGTALGPMAMPLTPLDYSLMCGRSGFFIHADSIAHPGQASEGCIVASTGARQTIDNSKDDLLVVIR
jgi:hypothetical protein